MSTVERQIIIREHDLKAEEARNAHMDHSIPSREAAMHLELDGYLQAVLEGIRKKNRKKHNAMVRTISQAKMKIEEFSAQKRVANYFFDYNTVEQVLLMCAIFICLTAIMFQSDKFRIPVKNSNGVYREITPEDDLFDYTFYSIVLVISGIFLIGSLLYYFVVFLAEVLGYTPKWVMRLCSSKAKRSDMAQGQSGDFDDEIQLANMANPMRNPDNLKLRKERSELAEQLAASEDANRELVQHMKKLKKANVDYDVLGAKVGKKQNARKKKEMPQVRARRETTDESNF